MTDTDTLIIGAGAAGLSAAIWTGRTHPQKRTLVLDGAKKLGAKILVAGGGRCNVTHDEVDPSAYAGSSRNAVKKVLRRFDVPETIAWFRELGVQLKREETGKLFPTTDKARTVLDGLLRGTARAKVEIEHPYRVESVEKMDDYFRVYGDWGVLTTRRLVLATGGKSIPKSGSDGHGYKLAQALGHTLTERIFPALVPLTLPRTHFLCQLSGITLPATLTVRAASGKQLQAFTNSTLLTHFGLSGPAPLDISRYFIASQFANSQSSLTVNWLPDTTPEQFEHDLLQLGKTHPLTHLRQRLPSRLAETLIDGANIRHKEMTRVQRKAIVELTTRYPLPITGNRGYNYAEVTAGGVPLSEINLKTMESRICPGLYLCGEICDVDGRIGGYNFQWAWASGYVVGNAP
ncbi:MAG: NAD(P)/FAD-dependent oxidoreductase [Chloroflexota bacterium]